MNLKKESAILLAVLISCLIILALMGLENPILFLIAAAIIIIFIFKPKPVLLALIPICVLIAVFSNKEIFNYPEITFLALCILIGWLTRSLTKPKLEIKNKGIFYLIVIFALTAAIVGFLKGSFQIENFGQIFASNALSPLFGMRILLDFFFISMIIIIISNEFKKEEARQFVWPIIIGGLIVILFSFIHLSDFGAIERFSAFQSNPNRYSVLLLLFLPIFLSLSLFSKGLKRFVSIPLTILIFILISFTISRNSIVLALVISGIFVIKKINGLIKSKNLKNLVFALAVIAVIAIIVFQTAPIEKISSRFNNATTYCPEKNPTCRSFMNEYSLNKAIESPVFGSGMGSYREYLNYTLECMIKEKRWHYDVPVNILYRNTHMHNIIFDTLYNTGFFGLLLFSAILFAVLKNSWKNRDTPLKGGIFYSLAAVLANSMLDMPLYGTEVSALFYILAGIALIKE